MRTILAFQIATLLFLSTTCIGATVEYQHPDLTIVAREEPLVSVLESLGKKMRIYVTIPTGVNPVINCDIQQQPINQAFKTLLGDVSYSLEWADSTGRLAGVTILAGGGEAGMAIVSDSPSQNQPMGQPASVSVASSGGLDAGLRVEQSGGGMPANEAPMEAERDEGEGRMVEEQEAQEERLKEEVERHDSETAAYLESLGLFLDQ